MTGRSRHDNIAATSARQGGGHHAQISHPAPGGAHRCRRHGRRRRRRHTSHGGATTAAYAIGLWGDLPYNDVQKTVGVPNLIADMNGQELAFTVHDGDLKAGSGPCPDSLYTDAKAMFNTLRAPAIFTPGDNDWTDCDRNAGD